MMPTPNLALRTLDVLEAVGRRGVSSLPEIAQDCGISTPTTYRVIQSLISRGFVVSARRGSYRLGAVVASLAEGMSLRQLLRPIARPHILWLARLTRCHAHLGVWEDDMVTYLVKQSYGQQQLHSTEGGQLEAYCSAIGKVLLASLPDEAFEAYLGSGDLVRLTSNTIVDPELLREEILAVRQHGFATDSEEITERLRYLAVPVFGKDGEVLAAVSISIQDELPDQDSQRPISAEPRPPFSNRCSEANRLRRPTTDLSRHALLPVRPPRPRPRLRLRKQSSLMTMFANPSSLPSLLSAYPTSRGICDERTER